MVFNRGFERLFPRFKKTSGNKFHRDGLAGESVILINDLMKVLIPGNAKINSR